MTKQVLLARPHPFIVSKMTPFLERNGFSPVKLGSLSELSKLRSIPLSGAIISIAVQSSIDDTAEAVLVAIRKQFPHLPVAFAGLLEMTMASNTIKHMLLQTIEMPNILAVEAGNERHVGLGNENSFIYIRHDDLSTPDAEKITAQMLQRHFQ